APFLGDRGELTGRKLAQLARNGRLQASFERGAGRTEIERRLLARREGWRGQQRSEQRAVGLPLAVLRFGPFFLVGPGAIGPVGKRRIEGWRESLRRVDLEQEGVRSWSFGQRLPVDHAEDEIDRFVIPRIGQQDTAV